MAVQRAKKGTVKIVERSEIFYLDFWFQGKRFRPSTSLPVIKHNRLLVEQCANKIAVDIVTGHFDPTLEKYFTWKVKEVEPKKTVLESPTTVYELWLLEHGYKGNYYESVRSFLNRTKPTWKTLENTVANQSWNATTFNRSVKLLNRAFEWGHSKHGTTEVFIPLRKNPKVVHEDRQPFTESEIKMILEAFESDRFVPKGSRFSHSHYVPFVKFLLLTGCRIGEIAGLKWKYLNFADSTVTIAESLVKQSNYSTKRVQKGTKTGSVRVLPLPQKFLEKFLETGDMKGKEDYVFLGHYGKPIDGGNFSQRVWKPVLEGLGIPYRVPYAARHTMASRAIEQGIPLTGIAYLMGHADTTMVMKQYGHMINRPELPTLDIAS